MAVRIVDKLTLIVHQEDVPKVVTLLQETSAVELINLPNSVPDEQLNVRLRQPSGLTETSDLLTRIEHTIGLLKQHGPKVTGLKNLFTERIAISSQEMKRFFEEYDFQEKTAELIRIEDDLRKALAKKDELLKKKDILIPWVEVPLSIRELMNLKSTGVAFGVVNPGETERILNTEHSPLFVPISTFQTSVSSYILFLYHRSLESQFRDWFAEQELDEIHVPATDKAPRDEIELIQKEIAELDSHIESLKAKIAARASEKEHLMVARDHVASQLAREEAEGSFIETVRTAVIEGWILAERIAEVEKKLQETIGVFHMEVKDPDPNEIPPTILETPDLAEPFQMVTGLYGLPDYREIDPTPYIAPTFALFFGICISDVGYGLSLALITWLMWTLFPVEGGTKSALKVLFWGGIATMLFGPLCGSYFGIEFSRLPQVLQKIAIFPSDEPMRFLVFSLILGFAHIYIGLIFGIIKKARQGKVWEGVMEKVPWMVLLPTLALLLMADQTGLSGAGKSGLKYLSIVSALAVVVLTPVGMKNPFARVGSGLYNLYGITGFLGDILSYSRLMAFGLVTGGIAAVINQLAGMLKDAIPVIGILFALLLLIGGHAFNLAVNTLGAFVHTARLHYLEFFNKFYDGSGKSFKPLRRDNRYTIMQE